MATAFWALDRLIRLARVLWSSVGLSATQGVQTSRAEVRCVAPNLYEMSIRLVRDWHFCEGQYVFLSLPSGVNWLQSHPFTVLDYETPSHANNSDATSIKSEDEDVGNMEDAPLLRILLRARGGLTATLPVLAAQSSVPILVEGPYGQSKRLPLDQYDNVTFVAGGVGFAALFCHAKRCARGRPSLTQAAHFVLVLRETEEYRGLLPYLEVLSAEMRLSVFITQHGLQQHQHQHMEASDVSLPTLPNMQLEMGHRPEVKALIQSDSHNPGSLAVVACGPCVTSAGLACCLVQPFSADCSLSTEAKCWMPAEPLQWSSASPSMSSLICT